MNCSLAHRLAVPLLEWDPFRTKKGTVPIETFTCNERVSSKCALQRRCVSGCNGVQTIAVVLAHLHRYTGSQEIIYIFMSASGTLVLFFFQGTGFSGSGISRGHDLPGPGRGFSAGVCFGVVALSLPQAEEFPGVVKS